MHNDGKQAGGGQPRINTWRISKYMLLVMVLPCTIAIIVDRLVGAWPFVTLLVAGFVFPIAGFLVMWIALQEMQKVIQQIAPPEPEANDATEDLNTKIGA
jgi:UPF0716 family protein affecting phage T7 exclusion